MSTKSKEIVTNQKMQPANQKNTEIQRVSALYPNPTNGHFKVRFNEQLKNATVYISDGSGKMLLKKLINNNVEDFDISTFSAGTYFLYIGSLNKTFTAKVIKQ